MMQLELTYDDLRKLGTVFRKPEGALTACDYGPDGGLRATVRGDLARVPDVGKFVKSLIVSITVDMELTALGGGQVECKLLDLNLDKSKAPLLVRPFLRPGTFRKILFKQLGKNDDLAVNAEAGTIVADINDSPKLKELGLQAEIETLTIAADGVSLGLTLTD